MKFHYKSADNFGKISEGDFEASAVGDVLHYLATKGLRPVSIAAAKKSRVSSVNLFGAAITSKDTIFLTRYLSLMLKVGTDLFSAINILINNFDKPALRSFLTEVRTGLEKGDPFYAAFARYPNYFSPVFINLVKAGEASGTLDRVFENLSVTLEREEVLRNNIKAATFYPIILFVMAALILLFLVTFAIPKIANVFLSAGVKPPGFSQIVFSVGLFMGRFSALFFGGFFALLFGAFVFFKRPIGRRFGSKIISRMPLIRKVVYKLAIQRFTATLSSLLEAGLPITDALEISSEVVGSNEVRSGLRRVSREGLAKGLTLGDAFQKDSAFPPVVANLIAISEKTGNLSEILKTISRFYEEEASNDIKQLVTILEPLMLVAIGSIVGLIALSVIVPVYQLVGQFR